MLCVLSVQHSMLIQSAHFKVKLMMFAMAYPEQIEWLHPEAVL